MSELKRLSQKNGNNLPETGLAITIETGISDRALKKLLELMEGVIELENYEDKIDELWEKHLPQWFVSKTKHITRDELLTNNELWDFGSWIDAMKQRGWKWWGHKILKGKVVIYLETVTFPYNIDPFFYMLYSIGIDLKETSVIEIYPNSSNLTIS